MIYAVAEFGFDSSTKFLKYVEFFKRESSVSFHWATEFMHVVGS